MVTKIKMKSKRITEENTNPTSATTYHQTLQPRSKKTSIGISVDTYNRIAGYGRFGDSLEDIIIRIIDFCDSRNLVKEVNIQKNKYK